MPLTLGAFRARYYTRRMTTPEKPAPFPGLYEAGRHTAEEIAVGEARREIENELKSLYIAGTMLYQAHRRRVLERIGKAGGVRKYHEAYTSSGGQNYALLRDGTSIYAHQILKAPEIVLDRQAGMTSNFSRGYSQAHTLQLGFGGRLVGGNMERPNRNINGSTDVDKLVQTLVEDGTFFPEEIGIIEGVTTTVDGIEDDIRTEAYYSVHGQIWRPNLFRMEPMPDPYAEPEAYRRWALEGNTQLNTRLQAPVANKEGEPVTTTVIDHYGVIQPSGEVAMEKLRRFHALIGYYAARQFPELFPEGQPNALGLIEAPTTGTE